jgi:hypothetical protein
LEEAFAKAYSGLTGKIQCVYGAMQTTDAAELVTAFLREIQKEPPSEDDPEWTLVSQDGGQPYWEHAKRLDGARLERVLHDFLLTSSTTESLDSAPDERVKAVLRRQGPFVALVDESGRFKSLVDRQALLEALANSFLASSGRPG